MKFLTVLEDNGKWNVTGCHSTESAAQAECDRYNGDDDAEPLTVLESDEALSAGSIVTSNGKGAVEEVIVRA